MDLFLGAYVIYIYICVVYTFCVKIFVYASASIHHNSIRVYPGCLFKEFVERSHLDSTLKQRDVVVKTFFSGEEELTNIPVEPVLFEK